MATRIDPSADELWDAVAYVATETGVEDRQPRTQAQWQALRVRASILLEASAQLAQARRVGDSPRVRGPGELSSARIEQLIAANPSAFAAFAEGLQRATRQMVAAIDARSASALEDAGGILDDACEACHVTYWYPDQGNPRP